MKTEQWPPPPVSSAASAQIQAVPSQGSETTGAARQLRVLIVDDLVDAAESMALLLRKFGHEVRTVYDGISALSAAEEFFPDVVLLDLALPKLDGFQVATRLRQSPQMQRVCLIALSGYGRESDIARSKQVGCDYHLLKPANFDDLQMLLGSIAVN